MSRDGVLKFNCHWTKTVPDLAWPWQQLDALRLPVFTKGLIGVNQDGVGFGNISLRVNQSDDFIVTGTQTGHLPTLQPEHLTRVVGFDLEHNRLDCQGPIQASSESMTHACIYHHFKMIQCVIHVHHQGMWKKYRDVLPTTSSQAAYGTPEMARAITNLFKDQKVYQKSVIVMGGHEDGLLFIGEDPEDAGRALNHHFSPWN